MKIVIIAVCVFVITSCKPDMHPVYTKEDMAANPAYTDRLQHMYHHSKRVQKFNTFSTQHM